MGPFTEQHSSAELANAAQNKTSCGTVFQITPTGKLTTVYSFCSQPGCRDGLEPVSGVIQAEDGNFYGTTMIGGGPGCLSDAGCGTVYQLTPAGVLTTLHSFDKTDGEDPVAALLQGTNGVFYGETLYGGTSEYGTVFGVNTGLGPFVAFVRGAAKAEQQFGILGQGFTGTTAVSLNGTPASFTVKSDTFILATVPAGATTGYVTVTTPSGTLTSNKPFVVIP